MSQAGLVDIESSHPQIPTEFVTDDGVAVPIANTLEILGTAVAAHNVPLETTGSGNTVTIEVQYASSAAATDATEAGVASFDSAFFTVDANGFVSFVGGSVAESFNVDASTPPGTDPVVPSGLGIVTVTGGQVASGTTTNVIRTNSLAANTYTIEIQRSSAQAVTTIGSNGVSHFNSAFFTVDANGFVSISGTAIGQTITGQSGGALSPTAGNWNIFGARVAAGATPVATSGAGSTLTVNVQTAQAIAATNATNVGLAAFNNTQFSVDANGFVSLIGGSLAVDSFAMQTGTSPVVPTVAGLVTFSGATVAAGTNPVRTDGTGANTMTLEVQISQAIAATDATRIGLAAFNSAHFSVDANGFVSLSGGGEAIDSIAVQTGTSPIVPTVAGLVTINGAVVAAGTNPVRTDGTGANTMAVEVQIAQAIASTNATNIGLSAYNSAHFTVDANGFVSLSGTGAGRTITGDTGGALPPTAGNWNILGGPGVTTSGSGSTLTINSVVFTDTTATTLAVDNGYNATAAGTYNLPATAAQGELLEIFCDTTGAVVLDAPASNFIRIGSQITTSGGTATSNAQGDSLKLRYRLSTLTWEAISVVGTWTLA